MSMRLSPGVGTALYFGVIQRAPDESPCDHKQSLGIGLEITSTGRLLVDLRGCGRR